MNKYNLIIIENKVTTSYLNISQQELFDTLWKWTYEDDLWDYLDENNPDKEELENVLNQFIEDNMFHKYEDDDIDCFAFYVVDDKVIEYTYDNDLEDYLLNKIEEHYGRL